MDVVLHLQVNQCLRCRCRLRVYMPGKLHTYIFRVGQNHVYTVCIRYFWQGLRQMHGVYIRSWPTLYIFKDNMHVLQSPGITQQFGRGKEGKYPPLTRHSRKWRHLFRGATNLGTTKQMYEKVNGNQKHNSKAKVRHSESVGTKSMALERSMGTESMALRINGD